MSQLTWLAAVAPNVSLITFTHHARANHALRLLEIPLLPEARSTPENVGVMTDDGLVSPTQVRQIVEMMNQGESGAAIERAIWGYDGAGWHCGGQRTRSGGKPPGSCAGGRCAMTEIIGLVCSSAVVILATIVFLWDEYGDALIEAISSMADDGEAM